MAEDMTNNSRRCPIGKVVCKQPQTCQALGNTPPLQPVTTARALAAAFEESSPFSSGT